MTMKVQEHLKVMLGDGREIAGFQHVKTTDRTSDYSVLLRSGDQLRLYTVICDGDRIYGNQMHSLTEDKP